MEYELLEVFAVVFGGSIRLAGNTCALQKGLLTTLCSEDSHSVCENIPFSIFTTKMICVQDALSERYRSDSAAAVIIFSDVRGSLVSVHPFTVPRKATYSL